MGSVLDESEEKGWNWGQHPAVPSQNLVLFNQRAGLDCPRRPLSRLLRSSVQGSCLGHWEGNQGGTSDLGLGRNCWRALALGTGPVELAWYPPRVPTSALFEKGEVPHERAQAWGNKSDFRGLHIGKAFRHFCEGG